MTTRRIPIGPFLPATSFCRHASLSEFATNDLLDVPVMVFGDSGVDESAACVFSVPSDYVGAPKIAVIWTATAASSGDVIWKVPYYGVTGNDTESVDPAAVDGSPTTTDASPGATMRRIETLVTLTAGDLTANGSCFMQLMRNGAAAGDTMSVGAVVTEVLFEYSDT